MRILIVNPAQDTPALVDAVICRCAGMERKAGERLPPIGLAHIASLLKKRGHQVNLIDCAVDGTTPERFVKLLKRKDPELVLSITCKKTEGRDFQYLKLAKDNGCLTALCGGYPTIAAKSLMRKRFLDFVIMGEPEITALELADALDTSKNVANIHGLAHRKKGDVRITKKRKLIQDLDLLPFPAREYLQNEKYTSPYSKKGAQTIIISSRGCPYRCTFCTKNIYYGNTYRFRSAKNTVDEMEDVVKKYGIRDFSFQDDNFTQNRKRVIEICEEIEKRGLDIAWQCTSRVDCVDLNMLKKMETSGCYLIKYGIESGDEKVLYKMRKGIALPQVEKAVEQTKKAGITVGGSFILGSPGDNAKTMMKTALFASRLPLDYASFSKFENLGKNQVRMPNQLLTIILLWEAYCGFYLAPSRLKTYAKKPTASARAAQSILRYLIKKCCTQ